MSISFVGRSLGLVSLLLVAAGCVPYVQHQKLAKELDRANEVNRDLERALNAERVRMSELGGDARLVDARWNAAQNQIEGLQSQLEACESARDRLEEQLSNMPALPIPMGFSESDSRATGLERTSTGALILRELNFSSGKSGLKESQRQQLAELSALLKTKYADQSIRIEGHTDIAPINRSAAINKDNWDLSLKRAHAVFQYLTTEGGIPEDRFVLIGYGYSRPAEGVSDPKSADGMKQCRRVEVRLGS
ncbi:MAG: OmpA family protein [Planctomycetes bacterium]|nr:OmpA family protein [Planctomycetota bacterium]